MNTKKLLLTLFLLVFAGSAFAECALYAEDFEVSQSELGTEIIVPVKAHFSARLNAWQVDLTLPPGLQVIDATVGADQKVTYRDSQGIERTKLPHFYGVGSNNRVIAIFSDKGYWQDPNGEDPEAWVPYGQIKWEGGDYEEMIMLHLLPSVLFRGGDIYFNTVASSTRDSRGGTIIENGDENVHFTRVCHVTVEGVSSPTDPIEVDAPVITTSMDDDYVYVVIHWPQSPGPHVYTGKYMYARGEEDAEYEVEAYVKAYSHFAESVHAIETILVPAKEESPDPGPDPDPDPTPPSSAPQIVLIDTHGIEHSHTMNTWPEANGEYAIQITTHHEIFGENVPFYFMIDGKRYGPETNMQVPLMTNWESVTNPIVEGENMWCVPTRDDSNTIICYTYSIGLEFFNDEIAMLIAQGIICGEEDEVQTEEPVFYGYVAEDESHSHITDYFVEITPKEPSTIYYRVQYPDETWSNWGEYENVLHFTEDGFYCVEAFALADGKVPSDEIQYWFVISPYTSPNSVNEVNGDKAIACVRYFNMAGQEMPAPDGVTIIVTTYTDGTTSAIKVMK